MLAEVASPGAEMQELLGPSDSDKLKDYNITLGSRQTVNMISQSVVGQGLLLTQAERDVVSNAVTQFPGSRPGDADLADSTQSLARREANDDAIVKAVSKSLSPASTSAIKLALASETAKVKLGSALMDRTAPDKQ
jgi:adenosine/AMP kinase